MLDAVCTRELVFGAGRQFVVAFGNLAAGHRHTFGIAAHAGHHASQVALHGFEVPQQAGSIPVSEANGPAQIPGAHSLRHQHSLAGLSAQLAQDAAYHHHAGQHSQCSSSQATDQHDAQHGIGLAQCARCGGAGFVDLLLVKHIELFLDVGAGLVEAGLSVGALHECVAGFHALCDIGLGHAFAHVVEPVESGVDVFQ